MASERKEAKMAKRLWSVAGRPVPTVCSADGMPLSLVQRRKALEYARWLSKTAVIKTVVVHLGQRPSPKPER